MLLLLFVVCCGVLFFECCRSDIGVVACYVFARAFSNKRFIRNVFCVFVGLFDCDDYVVVVCVIDKCEFLLVVLLLKGLVEVVL